MCLWNPVAAQLWSASRGVLLIVDIQKSCVLFKLKVFKTILRKRTLDFNARLTDKRTGCAVEVVHVTT